MFIQVCQEWHSVIRNESELWKRIPQKIRVPGLDWRGNPDLHKVMFITFNTNYVFLGLGSGDLKVYNRTTREWKMFTSDHNPSHELNRIRYIECTQKFVISGSDYQICVWDIDTGEQKEALFLQEEIYWTFCLADKKLHAGNYDGFIKIWELKDSGNLEGF